MKNALVMVLGVILFIAVVYGIYWVGKTVSYKIFYQDMVKATITEMVKAEALK